MLSHTIGGLDLVRSGAIGLDGSMHCHRVSIVIRLVAVQPTVAHSDYHLCRSTWRHAKLTHTQGNTRLVCMYVCMYLAPVLMKFLRDEAL